MRKLLLGMVSATALAFGSAAGAVVTVDSTTTTVSGPTTVADTTTIGFTEASLSSPTFMESVVFTNTLAGLYSVTLTTSSPDIDFTSAFLAGLGGPYDLIEIDDDGTNEFWRLANPVELDASTYTLTINGNNSGAGSLGGSITIRQANAVPEPATWAMMLLGFGAVGFAVRRRRKPVLAQLA
jgi:hypothetical protein